MPSTIGIPTKIVFPKQESKNILTSVAFEKLKIKPKNTTIKAARAQLKNPINIKTTKEKSKI